jgi:hypothetical protein
MRPGQDQGKQAADEFHREHEHRVDAALSTLRGEVSWLLSPEGSERLRRVHELLDLLNVAALEDERKTVMKLN